MLTPQLAFSSKPLFFQKERTHTGIPWLLTHAPNGVRAPAPLLGQDTDYVMRDVLGYSPQELARLKEEQVLY